MTYNFQLGAMWRFGKKKDWGLSFGWRYMSIDFEASGIVDQHKVDIAVHGPFIAIAWGF